MGHLMTVAFSNNGKDIKKKLVIKIPGYDMSKPNHEDTKTNSVVHLSSSTVWDRWNFGGGFQIFKKNHIALPEEQTSLFSNYTVYIITVTYLWLVK